MKLIAVVLLAVVLCCMGMTHRAGAGLRAWMVSGAVDPVHGHGSRTAVIHRSELVTIHAGCLLMGNLYRRPFNMCFAHCYLVPCGWSCPDASGTVETGSGARIMDHGTIDIGIVDHGSVDIHDRGIVAEMTA
jgi:hypothetical protein